MKKTLILLMAIFTFYIFISNGIAKKITIPDDALRIRIIPNSNSNHDQFVKGEIRDKLQITMYDLLKDAKSSDEAREIIKKNLNLVDKDVQSVLKNNDYKINYGLNYFPAKEYKGITYASGYYESLLVTLGKGKGDNWWCVLFPPLCLIEGEENTDVEYRSLVVDMLHKYLPNS